MQEQNQGWVKVFRQLLDKPIWQQSSPAQKTILITLLLMANHEEKEWEWKGQKFKASPGQFITSLDSIVKKCGTGISIQNVRSALVRFKKFEFLTNESTKTGRLITIVNWRLYQLSENDINIVNNKEVTKHQQSTNKEVTPNKNDKNDKNNKKYIDLKFIDEVVDNVHILLEQYDKLVVKFGKELTHKNIIALDNYIANGKGNKYKDHYRALNTWCGKDSNNILEKPSAPTPAYYDSANKDNTCPLCKGKRVIKEENKWVECPKCNGGG